MGRFSPQRSDCFPLRDAPPRRGGRCRAAPWSPSFLVRGRSQAHGLPAGTNYGFFGTLSPIDGAGNVMFATSLEGAGTSTSNNGATFIASATGIHLLRRTDDPVPDLPDARWGGSSGLGMLNESGQTFFESDLRGAAPGTEATLWFGDPFNPTLVARAGQEVQGEPGLRFGGSFDDLYLDDSGHTVFTARADPADVSAAGPLGLWRGRPGDFELVVTEGAPAPGAPDGVIIHQLDSAAVNANGIVLFTSTLTGAGITGESNEALFAGTPDDMQLIAREGDFFEVAPGDVRQIRGFDFPGRAYLEYQLNDGNQVLALLRFADGSSAIYLVTVPEPRALVLLAAPVLLLTRRRR